MKLCLLGLEGSGKSTLFRCLTHGFSTTEGRLAGMAFSMSSVAVPDQRLDELRAALNPAKCTPSQVEMYDFPGLASASEAGSQVLAAARESDCLVLVMRDFENQSYPHPAGSVDRLRDEDDLRTLLALSDLEAIEKRMEKLKASVLRPTEKQKEEKRELEILKGFKDIFDKGGTLAGAELAEDDDRIIRGFRFLTRKPLVKVLNVSESDASRPAPQGYSAICAKGEADILDLDEAERGEFIEALGIGALKAESVVREAYGALGLVTFYTTASDELRAWTVTRGASAQAAAGRIHTDMERGFIRAEVAPWNEVAASAREGRSRQGLFRLEGKGYEVRDGDVITFRFSA